MTLYRQFGRAPVGSLLLRQVEEGAGLALRSSATRPNALPHDHRGRYIGEACEYARNPALHMDILRSMDVRSGFYLMRIVSGNPFSRQLSRGGYAI